MRLCVYVTPCALLSMPLMLNSYVLYIKINFARFDTISVVNTVVWRSFSQASIAHTIYIYTEINLMQEAKRQRECDPIGERSQNGQKPHQKMEFVAYIA